MADSRTLRVETSEWQRLRRAARAGAEDGVAGVLADHLAAPVKAQFVTTAGDRGTRSRLTMIGGQAVLVTQRIASVGTDTVTEPGAQITFTGPDALWTAIARTLPDTPLLRAPATAAGTGDHTLDLTPEAALRLLDRETYALRVRVEAWASPAAPSSEDADPIPDPGPEERRTPLILWNRLWSVVDDRLIDVRTDDGDPLLVERPAGSVEKELRWALTGALDATYRQEVAR